MAKEKMIKKNNKSGYTSIMSKAITKNIQLVITIGGVVVALLNIWVVTKLSPLAQDIAVLSQRVYAVEDSQVIDNNTITSRLDRIEAKVDRLIERIK